MSPVVIGAVIAIVIITVLIFASFRRTATMERDMIERENRRRILVALRYFEADLPMAAVRDQDGLIEKLTQDSASVIFDEGMLADHVYAPPVGGIR